MTTSVAAKRLHETVHPPRITMVELARKCGVTTQSAWAWASGKKRPSIEHRRKIARLTGIPVDAWDQSPVSENDTTIAPDPEVA